MALEKVSATNSSTHVHNSHNFSTVYGLEEFVSLMPRGTGGWYEYNMFFCVYVAIFSGH